MPKGLSKNHPIRLKARLRASQALELRLASKTWDTIAQELGYGSDHAAKDAVMSLLNRQYGDSIEEFRRNELARLEKLRESKWPDAPTDAEALNQYLSLTDRIHRIMGINTKVELTGKNGAPLPAPNVTMNFVKVDLNVLSDPELAQYQELLAKLSERTPSRIVEGEGRVIPPQAE